MSYSSSESNSPRAVPAAHNKPNIPARFKLLQDFCTQPAKQNWIVRGHLEPDTTTTWFGDSQAFKSFLAIDLVSHIATGLPWRGRKTEPGFCLYIAGEGGNGLSRRFKAWFHHHGEEFRNIAVSTVPLALCDPANVGELIKDISAMLAELDTKASVIVIDTLSTHFGDGDENKTSDMRQFTRGINQLRIATGAAVLVIHHVGHANKDRERGSISSGQDVDWRYRVERQEDTNITTLTCLKARDADKPTSLSWNLKPVALPWLDEGDDGNPVPMTSLVPVPVEAVEQTKPESLPRTQRIAVDALMTALMSSGVEDKGVVSVAEDQWRQAAYDAGISDSDKQDTRKRAFNRARQDLLTSGKVSTHEGRFWIPKPTGTKRDKTGHCPEMSRGHDEGYRDKTGHIPLGMSRFVPCPDAQDTEDEPMTEEDQF